MFAQCTVTLLSVMLASVATALLQAAEPPAGFEIVHPVDGAIMVYVPAGPFTMGMDRDEADKHAVSLGYKDYHGIAAEEWFPRHQVNVEGYFIDKCEVTVEQWRRFLAATGYKPKLDQGPKPPKDGAYDLYPAVNVFWEEAQRYANWARKSLPYEAQWEKAARGTDSRVYPWGNEPLSEERGVFVDLKGNGYDMVQLVGSKPAGASPYGCLDMAGNVYEWTAEWMEPYPNNPEIDPKGPWNHQFGCLRGGSFYHGKLAYACAKRFGFKPTETYFHVGFRTVWVPPAGYFDSADFRKAAEQVKDRKEELAKKRAEAAPYQKGWF